MLWSNSSPDLCCCIQDGLCGFQQVGEYQGVYKVLCSTCTLVANSVLMSLEYLGNCNFSFSCSSIMFTRENVFHWNCTDCLLLGHGWQVGDTYTICAQRVILRGNAL